MTRLSPVVVKILACCSLIVGPSVFTMAADTLPAALTQVWLIDTRSAPGCGDLEAGLSQVAYRRLDESCDCGRWRASDAAAFQASAAPGVPTTVLIHGYGTDADWAVRHGNKLYGLMQQQACGRPFRLIVWSWPAERVGRRPRPNVQIKVCRSDVEAYYLARVLSSLPKGTPLSLVGFSLGCRTASAALQLLAAGPVAGRSLPREALAAWSNGGPRPIRVMMVAAAMDADWLEPCCPHGLAPLAVERVLITTNRRDEVMKLYSHLYGPHGPQALGHFGPAGTAGGKAEVVNVGCEVGRKHNYDHYLECSAVYRRLAWYTFLCDEPATAAHRAAQQ